MRVGIWLGNWLQWYRALAGFGWAHGDVDVFEDLAGCDALQAVGRFDEVVAFLSVVFASQGVDEVERFSQLLCLDEKARAIRLPFVSCGHHACHP